MKFIYLFNYFSIIFYYMTIGVIFFDPVDFSLYIKKNSREYYEDIITFEQNIIDELYSISKSIGSIFIITNKELNHITLLLNKIKYDYIFNTIINTSIVCVKLKMFNSIIIHNNSKHKRIKNKEIMKLLELIKNNYNLRHLK